MKHLNGLKPGLLKIWLCETFATKHDLVFTVSYCFKALFRRLSGFIFLIDSKVYYTVGWQTD